MPFRQNILRHDLKTGHHISYCLFSWNNRVAVITEDIRFLLLSVSEKKICGLGKCQAAVVKTVIQIDSLFDCVGIIYAKGRRDNLLPFFDFSCG